MAIELAAIRRSVPDASARDISFGVTGIGKIHTERYIAEIIKRAPEAIVVVGFCGGSDPALAPGDLHVAGSYLNPATGHSVDPDTDLVSELVNSANRVGLRVVSDPSATVPSVADREAKAQLYETTGAASVNMEDYWAASTARAAGVPFASLRAVLDNADLELPSDLTGSSGNVRHLLTGLIAHPGRLPVLLRLALLARTARTSLTRCMLAAINSLSPQRPAMSAVPK